MAIEFGHVLKKGKSVSPKKKKSVSPKKKHHA